MVLECFPFIQGVLTSETTIVLLGPQHSPSSSQQHELYNSNETNNLNGNSQKLVSPSMKSLSSPPPSPSSSIFRSPSLNSSINSPSRVVSPSRLKEPLLMSTSLLPQFSFSKDASPSLLPSPLLKLTPKKPLHFKVATLPGISWYFFLSVHRFIVSCVDNVNITGKRHHEPNDIGVTFETLRNLKLFNGNWVNSSSEFSPKTHHSSGATPIRYKEHLWTYLCAR
jgi:hypothetical protein